MTARRDVMYTALGLFAALAVGSVEAPAQEYPRQPVRVVLGYGAGGGADLAARKMAEKISELSNQPFVVLNKPGANGNLAANEVVKAKPDGYTLLWSPSSAYVSNHLVYKNTPYDPKQDLQLVSTFTQYGFVLLVPREVPANSVAELTEFLKKKNGGFYGASATSFTACAEMYKLAAGLKTQPVNYKTTGDAVRDLAGNRVDFAFADAAFALAQARGGQVKALAISLQKRISQAPALPTMDESGLAGYELNGWMGLAAPRATPPAVVLQLNRWVQQILAMPDIDKFIRDSGSEPFFVRLEDLARFQDVQIEKWRKLVATGAIKIQ
jgi:tripartite-type tricarboxylate transporter receptor subunit TctC